MSDNELELHQEVYEKLGWKTGKHIWSMKNPKLCRGNNFMDGMSFAYYNSDYLLEKLPKQYRQYWLILEPLQFTENTIRWRAYYQEDETLAVGEYASESTPLKALLKLTLALHEAGELKQGDTQ